MSEAHKGKKHHFYGKRHSIESRRKISEALKGENNPNFGKVRSVEHCRRISEANKGRIFSAEHRRKISESRKRHPECVPAHKFFLSLPSDMHLREKRKLLYAKFPDVPARTIRRWVSKWIK